MAGKKEIRVAIVGSGPAGFYAAIELLDRRDYDAHVDMYDRLPTPWGLVRAGVAPDHAKTKLVTKLFDRCAARPNFTFYLNAEVGKHVSHEALTQRYHAVLYSYGASASRALELPGEELPGSFAATEFVAWYNGHPDYAECQFDLSGERAVIVGNGNVALDIARILVKSVDELKSTDIADHALEALSKSNIKEVVIIGRRGVADAACTNPELLGLGDLENVDVIFDKADIEEAERFASNKTTSGAAIDDFKATLKLEIATEYLERAPQQSEKRIVFKFLRSPIELIGDQKVERLRVVRNQLEQQADGSTRAIAGDEFETIETGLVLRSVGYFGKSIPGVPFDEGRGVIPNDRGRARMGGNPEFGVYCAGWIKRGPSGVIGTNKRCARETVSTMLKDFDAGKLDIATDGDEAIGQLLSQLEVTLVDYNAWRRLNAHECEMGYVQERPRVKVTSIEEMLAVADP